MIMTVAMYLIVGAVVTLICASGGGRARIDIELLGKEIDQRWSLGILLANAILIWPVVLWLMVMGKKADGSAAESLLHDNGTPHPPLMQPSDKYASDFGKIPYPRLDYRQAVDVIQAEAAMYNATAEFAPRTGDYDVFTLTKGGIAVSGRFKIGDLTEQDLRVYVRELLSIKQVR